jgi:hypothetical protein
LLDTGAENELPALDQPLARGEQFVTDRLVMSLQVNKRHVHRTKTSMLQTPRGRGGKAFVFKSKQSARCGTVRRIGNRSIVRIRTADATGIQQGLAHPMNEEKCA